MAAKAQTLKQAKVISSNNFELVWWVFMRVSGVLLTFLVLAHIWMQNIAIDNATIHYEYVAERFSSPTWKIFDIFLLALTLLHGANGLRYVLDDYIKNLQIRFWVKTLVFTLVAAVFIIGASTLWSFSFQQVGDVVQGVQGH